MNVSPRSDKSWDVLIDEKLSDEEEYEIVESIPLPFNARLEKSEIKEKLLLNDFFTAAAAQTLNEEPVAKLEHFPPDLKDLFGRVEFVKIPYLDLAQKEISQIRPEDLFYRCMRFSNSKEGHSGLIYSADNETTFVFSGSVQSAASWTLTELPPPKPFPAPLVEMFGAETFKRIPILNLSDRKITEIKPEDFESSRALRLENQAEGYIGIALLIYDIIKIYYGPRTSQQEWLLYQIDPKRLLRTKTHIVGLQTQISGRQKGTARNNLIHQKQEAEERLKTFLTPTPINLAEKKEEIQHLYTQAVKN